MLENLEQVPALTFFSDPGVYEVVTEGGPVYDIEIPEDLTDTGIMLISKEQGKADDREGREILQLLEVNCEVGKMGELIIIKDEDYKTVKTKKITVIYRVQ